MYVLFQVIEYTGCMTIVGWIFMGSYSGL